MAMTACQCAQKKRKRHKIRIEASTGTKDQLGGQASDLWDNPTLITTAKAAIEPLRGGELFRAQQIQSPITHRVTINYRPGIKHEHRIKWTDRGTVRIFNIKAIIDVEEAHKALEIMAVENVPA